MRVHLSARQVLWKNRIRALCMHGVMGLLGGEFTVNDQLEM